MEKTEHAGLWPALAAAQAAFPPIPKNKVAQIKPGFSYKYADLADLLAAVTPVLAAHGLCQFQIVTYEDGGTAVETVLRHESGKDGEEIRGTIRCRCEASPQKIGSAITYLRRYGLAAILGVAPDADDDGRNAQEQAPRNSGRPSRPPAPRPPANASPSAIKQLHGFLRGIGCDDVAKADAVARYLSANDAGAAQVPGVNGLSGQAAKRLLGEARRLQEQHNMDGAAMLAIALKDFGKEA
jgi:hypothetical protein